jgi:hypothetical protein
LNSPNSEHFKFDTSPTKHPELVPAVDREVPAKSMGIVL